LGWARTRLRIGLFLDGIFLTALGCLFISNGQTYEGFVLLAGGGMALLAAIVYLGGWYENIDYGLRIIQAIFVVAVVGGISGYLLYGLREAIGGAILVGFVMEVGGILLAIYLYYRDERDWREYEIEMRKHGKEP
jgi:branched-subunit amino acid ABC-type transport system permease component